MRQKGDRYYQKQYHPRGNSPLAGTEKYTPHKKATPERLNEIRILREKNLLSFKQIAKLEDLSEGYAKALYQMSIGKRPLGRNAGPNGIKLKDIGADRRRKVSDEAIEGIRAMRAAGHTFREIAGQFGISQSIARRYTLSEEEVAAFLKKNNDYNMRRVNRLRKENPEQLLQEWAAKTAYRREKIKALSAEQINQLRSKNNG